MLFNLQTMSDSEHNVSSKFSNRFPAMGLTDFGNWLKQATCSIEEGDIKLLKRMWQEKKLKD